jgi:hypothetical protein
VLVGPTDWVVAGGRQTDHAVGTCTDLALSRPAILTDVRRSDHGVGRSIAMLVGSITVLVGLIVVLVGPDRCWSVRSRSVVGLTG